jgi:hypothetical protein
MRSYMICTVVQIYEGATFVKDEMGKACSVRGRDEKCIPRISKKPELMVELEIIMSMKKIILKGFVNKYGGKVGNGFIWIKTWINDSTGEDGSQTSGSMKGEGLGLKSDCFLLERLCYGIRHVSTTDAKQNLMFLWPCIRV